MQLLKHVALHMRLLSMSLSLFATQTNPAKNSNIRLLSLPDFPGKPIFEIKRVVLHLGILPNVQICHVSVTIKRSLALSLPSRLFRYHPNHVKRKEPPILNVDMCLLIIEFSFYGFLRFTVICFYGLVRGLQIDNTDVYNFLCFC